MTIYFGGGYSSDSDPGTAFVEGYKKSRLGKLLGDAYSAPKERRGGLLGQIAQIDPQAAQGADERFAKLDERAAKQLQEYARLTHAAWKSGNKPMAEGIYGQAVQLAKQVYPGFEAGPLDDSVADMFGQLANGASAVPAGMQEFNALTNGMGEDDIAAARRIRLGLDPRAVTSAPKIGEFEGADGRKRPTQYNPTTGEWTVFNGTDWEPLGRPASQPRGSAMEWHETGQEGAAPGGYRIDPALPPEVRAAIRQREGGNPRAWTSNTANPYGDATPGAVLGQGRRPEDAAYATETAKERAQLEALGRRGEIEADNAALKTQAETEARARGEAAAKVAQRARDDRESLMLLKEASGLLKTATSGGAQEMWKGANRYVGRTTEGAKADAQLNVLSGKLVGKVPRFEGPQSNIDVQLYQQMAGDLANPNKTRGERIAAAQGMINLIQKYQDYAKRPGTPAKPNGKLRYNPATGDFD